MSTISASTTSTTAYKVTADTTGNLVLQTGSGPTTAVTVDTSQNVGIGTASPASKLHVAGSFRQTGATAPFEWTVNAGASDYLKLNAVGYADNLIVANSSGNVGIGTSSPASQLDLSKSGDAVFSLTSAGIQRYQLITRSGGNFEVYDQSSAATRIALTQSGNLGLGVTPASWYSNRKAIQVSTGVAIAGSGSSVDYGFFATNYYDASPSGTNTYIGSGKAAKYEQSAGVHAWYTAGTGTAGSTISFTQALTLNNNGVLALQGGNTSANGIGIAFPATQSASSDANTLDDYEEGTWTPTAVRTFGSGTVSTNSSFGLYIKVGRQVTCWFVLNMTTSSITGTNVGISGLPFTSATTSLGGFNCGVARQDNVGGYTFFMEGLSAGSTQVDVMRRYDNGGLDNGNPAMKGMFTYQTAN